MKKFTGLLFLAIMVISCGDENESLKWINYYDPDIDEKERAEFCGDVECGEKQYDGKYVLCGICESGEYCDQTKRCQKVCQENSCGIIAVKGGYYGNMDIDCGKCSDEKFCSNNNICVTKESICDLKECGEVSFTENTSQTVKVDCGTCKSDEYCSKIQTCEVKSDECEGKCGTVSIESNDGFFEVECGGCTGDFAYCGVNNVCKSACDGKECGTDTVKLEDNFDKTYECGSCGDGLNYCDSSSKCQVACESYECGEETIYEFGTGEKSVSCGTCENTRYCDATLNCSEGTVAGDYLYDSSVVLDTLSGFMWTKANEEELTQSEAETYCDGLETAGFTDWSLPDISQLRSLVKGCDKVGTGVDTVTGDDSGTCGVISSCTESSCSDANCDGCTNNAGSGPQGLYLASEIWDYTGNVNGRFWSSSEVPDKADSFWFVRFSNASVAFNWDGSEYNVICVR